jgi:hypothetical protein
VLAEVGRPIILSLGIAGYRSVIGPRLRGEVGGAGIAMYAEGAGN